MGFEHSVCLGSLVTKSKPFLLLLVKSFKYDKWKPILNLETHLIEIERKIKFLDQETLNFDTIRLKTRTELISCYAVLAPAMFTLLFSFCIWAKNLTYIRQMT